MLFLREGMNWSSRVTVRRTTWKHKFCLTRSAGYGPYCGLAALAGDATVFTSGLRWNLHCDVLKMGVLTSSSNELLPLEPQPHGEEEESPPTTAQRTVIIETSAPIYWMCTISLGDR
jgi:hypothetical protein